ncbi:baseplate wedge subunit [Xanthomonas phage NEB7]|nr:baseplate wedge subunit [Xanthomonas phage NEB7]
MANDTLALDPAVWDLTLDAYGNVATVGDDTAQDVQTGPGLRLAQDVATRTRAWRGEVYFDTAQGIDYDAYLGTAPLVGQLQSDFQTEALKVPGCATALANFDLARTPRVLSGTLLLSDQAGNGAQVAV